MYFFVLIIFTALYGLYGMRKVDNFIENEKIENDSKILIYGDYNIVESVRKICETEKKSYSILNNNSIDKMNNNYSLLIILSNNDLDNLMICSLGKKWCNIGMVIALCNNIENKRIYESYGAMSIDYNDIYCDKFLKIIEEKINNV